MAAFVVEALWFGYLAGFMKKFDFRFSLFNHFF